LVRLYPGGHDLGVELSARVRPAAVGAADGALVLFHGRGADEHDLFPLLDALDPERRLAAATPRGPLALPPGGAHWYALGGIGTPEPTTFLSSFGAAAKWVDGFLAEQALGYDRLVLGGFSQGGVMAYSLGLGKGRPRPPGIIALSSFIPTVEGFELDLSPPLPQVAIGHGTLDPVIEVDWGRRARALLEDADAEVLYRETPMFHQIDPDFIPVLSAWIERLVPRHA